MYNSYVVSILVRLWYFLVESYEHSILKKILIKVRSVVSLLFKDSIFKSLVTDKKYIIENSFLYLIYKKIVKFYNKLFNYLNKKYNDLGQTSFIKKYRTENIRNLENLLIGILYFNISFNMGIIVVKIYSKIPFGIRYMANGLIILISILLIKSDIKILDMLSESKIIRTLNDFLKLEPDEGGIRWW